MFKNIGKKIQTLAKVVCWIGIIMSVLGGLMLAISASTLTAVTGSASVAAVSGVVGILVGILVAIFGSLASWIGSWMMYAFGQLVQDVHEMRNTVVEDQAPYNR